MISLAADQPVRHRRHGEGRVVADLGTTVVVRFGERVEQVEAVELEQLRSLDMALTEGRLDDPLEALVRAQALAIRSVNEQWGVFSRSRVQLLPHQLWVCRQVTRSWPARWLVADDVGLGKTIEAGLILEPLMATGRVRRVLILAPARLVPQWRERMKTMFDIRLQEFSSDLDRGKISFWDTAQQVVASFHTLRLKATRERLMTAEPWDLVIVDEAHHFQAQERNATLTYSLLKELQEKLRLQSLVLFTGTPHRGKDYGFLALMQLVRPDLFDPEEDIAAQLPRLNAAMIRNNKALVTDLEGNRLFQPVVTETVDYAYSAAEASFYRTMSEFILDGRAYALGLSGRAQTARMLLLIALQKLAASSISAIRAALERRRAALSRLVPGPETLHEEAESETLDDAAEAEERRPDAVAVLLMQDEIARLDEILVLARVVERETKIGRLIDLIETRLPPGEPVLLFTEYKATQALVLAALEERFGRGCASFINGEDRLVLPATDGDKSSVLALPRNAAAEQFNGGRTRFLIATEAGGEGIDLQQRCATLVHVDLPWNPMRLHQRVGRLNRYGQTRPVRVYLLRNPETVEARIWALLEAKLARIQAALSASMEEAEDIAQLVIGMSGGSFFDELFANSSNQSGERLSEWFDVRTSQFGGAGAVEAVRALVGNVARYDFRSVGQEIPKLDLPALESFFRNVMQHNGRRVNRSDSGLSVATPEAWRGSVDLRDRYDGLSLNRALPPGDAVSSVLGVGHALFDRALAESTSSEALVARIDGLTAPLLVAIAEDEVTGTDATVHRVILGAECLPDGGVNVLRDWELLSLLNQLRGAGEVVAEAKLVDNDKRAAEAAIPVFLREAYQLNLGFKRAKITMTMVLLPPLGADNA